MIYLKSFLAGMFGVIVYVAIWLVAIWLLAIRVSVKSGLGAMAGGVSVDPGRFGLIALPAGAVVAFAIGYYWMFTAASKNKGLRES